MNESQAQDTALAAAVAALRQGGVIAYPTSTIWGLGCDCLQQLSARRIERLKGRAREKGLLLVAGSWREFAPYFPHLGAAEISKITAAYPHPRSWLVACRAERLGYLARAGKLVIRVDKHPVVAALTAAAGGLGRPIISTSANPSGEAPAASMAEVKEYFGARLDYVYPAEHRAPPDARPSDIADLATGEFLRRG